MIFNLPDVGEGLSEAEIVEWHVERGDSIRAGEPMLSVETDKALVEIPAPESGVVVKLFAGSGDIVSTGKPLVQLETESGRHDIDPGGESTSVVGELRSGEQHLVEKAVPLDTGGAPEIKLTPAVRALARKHDVDLSLVSPTGRDGTISRSDIERVAARLQKLGPPEKLRGARRAMAITMSRSHAEVAPATLMDEIDVDHWPQDCDVTCRLLRALVDGCRVEPGLNAWYDGHAMTRRMFDKVNVALAMDTEDGLFTPVVRDVASLGVAELRSTIERLKTEVRNRQIARGDLRDFTIILSNYGTIAGRFAVAAVVPPTVAIVGAGRIYPGIAAVDQRPEVRRLLPLTLTFDHRAVTGGESGRFLTAMSASLTAQR